MDLPNAVRIKKGQCYKSTSRFSMSTPCRSWIYQQRTVFTEAGKDFVDFLFHVHALPIMTLAHIQAGKADSMDSSLGNLYKSFEDQEDVFYMMPHHKQSLLKPNFPDRGSNITFPVTLLLPSYYGRKVAYDPSVKCCPCDAIMDRRVVFVEVPTRESGYVKQLVKYVVMDDLMVKPMITLSCIAMFKDKAAMIVDKFIDFGADKGKLLPEALLLFKTVLTDIFLAKKGRNDLATISPLYYRP